MSEKQEELFDVGKRVKYPEGATPSPPGTGPDGMTCAKCEYAFKYRLHLKNVYKCYLMDRVWTSSRNTDIRLKWPACRQFKDRRSPMQIAIDDMLKVVKGNQ